MISEHIVQSMAQKIINAFSPEKIIVFGSWARNEATKDSDIDFLVITSYEGSKRDIQVAMKRKLKGLPTSTMNRTVRECASWSIYEKMKSRMWCLINCISTPNCNHRSA